MNIIKKSNTQQRLIQVMKERGLKQKDVLELTSNLCEKYNVKFNKSDISQYVSGKTEPNQDKLYILSKSLNLDVTWLMGYDTPTVENPSAVAPVKESLTTELNESQQKLLNNYNQLNEEGQEKAFDYVEDLVELGKYKKRGEFETAKHA